MLPTPKQPIVCNPPSNSLCGLSRLSKNYWDTWTTEQFNEHFLALNCNDVHVYLYDFANVEDGVTWEHIPIGLWEGTISHVSPSSIVLRVMDCAYLDPVYSEKLFCDAIPAFIAAGGADDPIYWDIMIRECERYHDTLPDQCNATTASLSMMADFASLSHNKFISKSGSAVSILMALIGLLDGDVTPSEVGSSATATGSVLSSLFGLTKLGAFYTALDLFINVDSCAG
jgi:hypothetical protein